MGKYTEQFKLTAVSAYLDGNNGFRKVAQHFDVDFSLLRRWVSSHQSESSLSSRSHGRRYDDDFKRQVLSYMHEHRLSMRQTAAHFGLGQSSQIGSWQRQYYSGDPIAPVDRQKKPIKVPKKIKPAKPTNTDDSQKPRDQLMAELEYLRMENAVLKELKALREEKGTNVGEKVLIVSRLKPRFPLPDLLRLVGLARSTFYYQVQAQQKPDKYAELKEQIQQVYRKEKGRYGYRRVALVIRKGGVLVNKKVIERLMAALGLQSLVRPKKYQSYRGVVGKIAPNLLERNFVAQRPNQKWVSDVTEFKVAEQKLYLSPVMDLYNGEIIAYETASRPQYSLVGNMLDKALKTLGEKPKLVLHTDQGWQYQQGQYRHQLRSRGVKQSMSRKGNCLDNAAMESFFGTLKSEFFYLKRFESIDELKAGLDEYIHYYNHDRIKLRLNGLSPVEYRTQAAA
ncbi:MAG: IS3 family transposase [Candidatus Pseudomonas phytovorans]|uniref:IS3 family transposase n=1 Tax=Candidatus Pseudomonas phytovorans TaxID=3121377 RepID=A0AAJ6BEC8_9PSED|nr:IS3 family transposase [Pseudomonas sp.]WEK28789.1 MAG: IS3 family transposase [Pseudomonas sp.]WEK29004.1 MAG: IS3 family transposase [Pseudomonas sp.]WEK29021.1 MAG: IS3 family transposase [Pseudomonas sp.]WEK31669.1 MAG: IS3 family transposase [Pseudomonas sp.]WEK32025.1 MAG: IS3 family transposase [Pseudomonas sp.]